MTKSVHDNLLVSYEVHCERREIRLLTEHRYGSAPFAQTVILFTGVEAYHFHHDCFGTILFDIEEVSAESILTERLAEFQEGYRLSGWPRFWRDSLDEVQRYLREQATRGFELSSSIGMTGWVLAGDMLMIGDSRVA
jgi:hypothetical protein